MSELKGFANVVFPARDLDAGVAAWKAMLGREPAFVGEDFAAFSGDGVELGLSALPRGRPPARLLEGRRRRRRTPRARRPRRDAAG